MNEINNNKIIIMIKNFGRLEETTKKSEENYT